MAYNIMCGWETGYVREAFIHGVDLTGAEVNMAGVEEGDHKLVGILKVVTDNPRTGNFCLECDTAAISYFKFAGTTSTGYIRSGQICVYFDALPGADVEIARLNSNSSVDASNSTARIFVEADGDIRITNGAGGTLGTLSGAVVADRWVTIEYHIDSNDDLYVVVDGKLATGPHSVTLTSAEYFCAVGVLSATFSIPVIRFDDVVASQDADSHYNGAGVELLLPDGAGAGTDGSGLYTDVNVWPAPAVGPDEIDGGKYAEVTSTSTQGFNRSWTVDTSPVPDYHTVFGQMIVSVSENVGAAANHTKTFKTNNVDDSDTTEREGPSGFLSGKAGPFLCPSQAEEGTIGNANTGPVSTTELKGLEIGIQGSTSTGAITHRCFAIGYMVFHGLADPRGLWYLDNFEHGFLDMEGSLNVEVDGGNTVEISTEYAGLQTRTLRMHVATSGDARIEIDPLVQLAPVTQYQTFIGMDFRLSDLPETGEKIAILKLGASTGNAPGLFVKADGTIGIHDDSDVTMTEEATSSTGVISADTRHSLVFAVNFAGEAIDNKSCQLWVDGVMVADYVGNHGAANVAEWRFGLSELAAAAVPVGGLTMYIDSLHISDSGTPLMKDSAGNIKHYVAYAHAPTGDGAADTGFTGTYADIDEVPSDEDTTTRTDSSATGTSASTVTKNSNVIAGVLGMALGVRVKSSTTIEKEGAYWKNGSDEKYKQFANIATSYQNYMDVRGNYIVNPYLPWKVGSLSALQVGCQRDATGSTTTLSTVWLTVLVPDGGAVPGAIVTATPTSRSNIDLLVALPDVDSFLTFFRDVSGYIVHHSTNGSDFSELLNQASPSGSNSGLTKNTHKWFKAKVKFSGSDEGAFGAVVDVWSHAVRNPDPVDVIKDNGTPVQNALILVLEDDDLTGYSNSTNGEGVALSGFLNITDAGGEADVEVPGGPDTDKLTVIIAKVESTQKSGVVFPGTLRST